MSSPGPTEFDLLSSDEMSSLTRGADNSLGDSGPPVKGPYIQTVGLPGPSLLLLAILFLRLISIQDVGQQTNEYPRQFISSRGNEYFCEIDEEYLTDRFNLTGLNTEVHYYQHALDLVNDVFDLDCDDEMREVIEKSARHLYGLVHARYIVTTRGLAKMLDKYKKADFGKCPRVICDSHPLLPMGQSDVPHQKPVKMYCAKCEDIYNPKATRHATIDGAYFGSSFHNILFQVYPALVPEKSRSRHVPRVFGFKVHVAAALARWQDGVRVRQKKRLREAGVENVGFVEDGEDGEEGEEGEEELEGPEGVEDGLMEEDDETKLEQAGDHVMDEVAKI